MARILHLTDAHIGKYPDGKAAYSVTNIDKIIQSVDKIEPDIIVFSGDITNNGFPREYAAAKQFLDMMQQYPNVIIPGNHDTFWIPEEGKIPDLFSGFLQKPYLESLNTLSELKSLGIRFSRRGNEILPKVRIEEIDLDGLEFFREYVGDTEPSLNMKGVSIIGVDSTEGLTEILLKGRREDNEWNRIVPEYAPELGYVGEGKETIKKKLSQVKGKKTTKILAIHHNIISTPTPRKKYDSGRLLDAGDLLSLIMENNIQLVLQGHTHCPYIITADSPSFKKNNKHTFVTGGACATQHVMALPGYPNENSYNIIDVEPDKLRVETWFTPSNKVIVSEIDDHSTARLHRTKVLDRYR
ncbi:MAG: metallophosphoesterase [archaeon]